MAGIVMPEWLQAPDIAGNYTRGLQIGSQIAEARARLDQQAQESQMRAGIAAEEAQKERDLQQQRIAVSSAYQQQQLQLRKQQLDEIKAVNDQKTAAAARQFQARQQWQQASSKIDADSSMTEDQKDAAKTRAIMQLAPLMGTAGTETAAMLRDLRPPKPTIPASIDTDSNPDYVIAHQPNGNISLHPKPKPKTSGGNVKVRLDPSTVVEMTQAQALPTIQHLPKDMQADPVNKAVVAGAYTPAVAKRQAEIFGSSKGTNQVITHRFDPAKGLVPVEAK